MEGWWRSSIRRGEDRGNATRAAGLPTVALHCMHIGQKVHHRIQKSHYSEPFTSSLRLCALHRTGHANAVGRSVLLHVDCRLMYGPCGHEHGSLGFMVNGVALGQVFPQYFCLLVSSFHQCSVHLSILVVLVSEGQLAES